MRTIFMGTGDFAKPSFEAIDCIALVTQPDRFSGRKRNSTRKKVDLKEIALSKNIPILQPEDVNLPESVAAIKELKPDRIIVAAYGQILSEEVLSIAPSINLHASLLPKYRGASPITWAIYNGEVKTGVTIIKMNHIIDDGDILMQQEIPIVDENAGELEDKLSILAKDMLVNFREDPRKQVGEVIKARKVKKEDGLIDWNRSTIQVINQVRAMSPWPSAYTYLHRPHTEPLRIIIHKLVAGSDNLFVKTLDGSVEIVEMQPEGKKVMRAKDFLNGNGFPDGSYFGKI